MECASLSGCGFFRKYQLSQSSSCKSFISNYCTGEKMSECKRKEYKLKNGVAPSDDMMPSGEILKV